MNTTINFLAFDSNERNGLDSFNFVKPDAETVKAARAEIERLHNPQSHAEAIAFADAQRRMDQKP